MRRRSAIHALLCAAAVAHASDKPAIISRFRLQHSAREEQRFAIATVLAKDPELLGRGRGRGGRRRQAVAPHSEGSKSLLGLGQPLPESGELNGETRPVLVGLAKVSIIVSIW